MLLLALFAVSLGFKLEAAKRFSAEKLGARDAIVAKAAESYELARERVESLRKTVADNADARPASRIQSEIDELLRDPKTEGCPAGQAWNGAVTQKLCPRVDKLRAELARAKGRDQAQADLKGAIEDWRKATPVVAKAATESAGPVALLLALVGISVTSWSALMSKPTVVTITSDDVKRLKKALKKGGRKTREGLDIPEAAKADGGATEAHKERVRGIALEHGIPMSIADEFAEQSDPAIVKPAATNKQLVAFIERVESVELELAERSEDRKQIYAEARSCGFDVPTLKKIVSLRKMDEQDRLEAEALLATYMRAAGMAAQIDMEF